VSITNSTSNSNSNSNSGPTINGFSVEDLLRGKPLRSENRAVPDAVIIARRKEQTLRAQKARADALTALSRAYPREYALLREAARRAVDEERGALPGDDLLGWD
jgi:hypothetical protein